MKVTNTLPPGQQDRGVFPRFGLSQFAERFPSAPESRSLVVSGDIAEPVTLNIDELGLTRVNQTSDFHCVTTWSAPGQAWSGFRFAELYYKHLAPLWQAEHAPFVVITSQDGYRSNLPLEDLLNDNVMIADQLNGAPLDVAHGAPMRLVAPDHYGYKNPKHISGIKLLADGSGYRPASLRFMDHPRARVAFEERGRGLPGWFYRYLYRPLVGQTIRQFERALARKAK